MDAVVKEEDAAEEARPEAATEQEATPDTAEPTSGPFDQNVPPSEEDGAEETHSEAIETEGWLAGIAFLHRELGIKSMRFIHYDAKAVWVRRPAMLEALLDVKQYFLEKFGNLKFAFREFDRNGSGEIVLFEWEERMDTIGYMGHLREEGATLGSRDLFRFLDNLDLKKKSQSITRHSFDFLELLDWSCTDPKWQELLLSDRGA